MEEQKNENFGPTVPQSNLPEQKPKDSKMVLTMIIIAAVLIVAALIVYGLKSGAFKDLGQAKGEENWENWQAVFLDNGQLYFGKIVQQNNASLVMKQIYYIDFSKPAEATETTNPNENFSLVKMGQELHGPKDEIWLNMEHVIAIQSMKPDSRVVEAIKLYQAEAAPAQ